jgi:uncharacterized membrane protein (UPF0136 family)
MNLVVFSHSKDHPYMISPLVGHITLGIYAALLAVGGIMGFVKARSRPSLITGLASAVAALVALWFSTLRSPFGFPLGMTLALVLFVFFGYRYALRNRQFMPSGMMAVVSLVVLGVMFMVLDWSR